MILNTQTKVPSSAIYYVCTKIMLVILLFSVLLSLVNKNFLGSFFGLAIFIGGPVCLYIYINLKSISFMIDESKLTVNSGIIIKTSKSIPLSNIQDANSSRNPLSSLFHISNLDIWTASPNQTVIVKGDSKNTPTMSLYLISEDAEWLKDFLLTPHITTQ